MIYKFTDTDYNIYNNTYYKLYNYYKEGGKYKKDASYHKYSCTWDDGTTASFSRLSPELLMKGSVRFMGWVIDFSDVWHKYLVRFKHYDHYIKIYAPSKTAIRDTFGNNNIVGKIIEL